MQKVAVLGAGVGGLTTANELIKNDDFKITVIEQSDQVGGRLQCINVDGYNYDIGATLLTPHFINFLDDKFDLDIDTIDIYWDTITLKERENLRIDNSKLAIEDIRRITGEKIVFDDFIWNALLFLRHYSDFRKKSIMDFLEEIDINPKLQVFLSSGAIDAGLPSDLAEAYVLKLMKYAHNFQYPVGGTSKIPETLANRLQEMGGELHLSTKVKSITDNGDDVEIVIAKNGKESKLEVDYVVSAMGVKHSLEAITNSSPALSRARKILENKVEPTIATTHFMYAYNGNAKKEYIERSPLNNYYPLDDIDTINNNMRKVMNGENIPFGFYSHFPALYDDTLVVDGKFPVMFMMVTTPNPSEADIEEMKEYIETEFDEYFLPGFKENAEFIGVDRPIDFIENYNDPGTTSNIAPIVGYPTFDSKMTEKIFLAGAGVKIDLAPSVIQASESGYEVAMDLEDHIRGRSSNSIIRFLRKIFGFQ